LEDRIRALEQKAVGWQVDGEVSEEEGAVRRQFGGLMVGIEDRIAKAKRELAEIEIRVEGALSRCGSMGGELQKMLKEQGEIKSALASLEIELGLEEGEADGMMAEWITVGRKGKQQQQQRERDWTRRLDGQQGKRLEEREEKRELISRWQELLPFHKLKKLW
jgi:hypothetical protein